MESDYVAAARNSEGCTSSHNSCVWVSRVCSLFVFAGGVVGVILGGVDCTGSGWLTIGAADFVVTMYVSDMACGWSVCGADFLVVAV